MDHKVILFTQLKEMTHLSNHPLQFILLKVKIQSIIIIFIMKDNKIFQKFNLHILLQNQQILAKERFHILRKREIFHKLKIKLSHHSKMSSTWSPLELGVRLEMIEVCQAMLIHPHKDL